ncbi:hypothetical protein TPHA_0H02640 [Tetrapisispora phaffii CBS 4417]|uniref:Outer spore wall protein RRT8 n=1 Tax=Tetrapisispora phaffii (strain ATCC 24235 / CBS 4417 / NBRC 1672 / NRRL Y-8282 / UCD 70-5) TaxID=1071381 RepID=G8BWL6_TETPH|nr:hypothetical protein TPHA_0H02640 [Tetrapisispora phaffii CBS 4417]CCE64467.1 hypothetical protein TPHA_0H02640 [Tetrapisispora phaffii CBS 4417]
MSLGGSCILSAIGGMVYKFDRNQVYERLPASQDIHLKYFKLDNSNDSKTTKQLNQTTATNKGIYNSKFIKFKNQVPVIFINFFKDFFESRSFILPINGIKELFNNFKVYMVPTLLTFIIYFLMYLLVSMAYFATITPVYTSLLLFLGPLGLIISLIHTVLQTNQLTMMFMRLSHFQNFVVKKYINQNDLQELIKNKPKPIKYYISPRTKYFWVYYLPKKLVKYVLGLLVFNMLFAISFAPIIGPFLFHFLIAPVITRIYVSKFFRLRGISNVERNQNFYLHLGRYTIIGLFAGLLENIPILSGFFLTSNTIAVTMWGIDEISKFE